MALGMPKNYLGFAFGWGTQIVFRMYNLVVPMTSWENLIGHQMGL